MFWTDPPPPATGYGDLYLAMAIVTILSCASLAAMVRITRTWSTRRMYVVTLVGFVWLVVYVRYVVDSPAVARVMPISSAIVMGNWSPIIAAALAGIVWRAMDCGMVRPAVTLVPLVVLSFISAWWPVFAARPATFERRSGTVHLQSTNMTCSPAAAASLLTAYGIPATEAEMVHMCLTTRDGTPTLGLYRGLKLKAAQYNYDVEFITADLNELRVLSDPVVLTCGIEAGQKVDERYKNEWGWKPGVHHSVVLYRYVSDSQIEIGDPAVGPETWRLDGLRTLWRGEAIRLVKRTGQPTQLASRR
jgi:hypothetical protein